MYRKGLLLIIKKKKTVTFNSSLSTDHMRLIKSEYVLCRLITKQLSKIIPTDSTLFT